MNAKHTMPAPFPVHPLSAEALAAENHLLDSTQAVLRVTYGILPVAAGADKFTNVLTNWEQYLNPALLRIVPLSGSAFMRIVGIIEIVAGILVFMKPRIGGLVVTAWLVAISLQLLAGWMFVDIAVRDMVLAVGACTLARLTSVAEAHRAATP
jgi:uncharacterized membrane protein YphA (DoxX/SURF4 family)